MALRLLGFPAHVLGVLPTPPNHSEEGSRDALWAITRPAKRGLCSKCTTDTIRRMCGKAAAFYSFILLAGCMCSSPSPRDEQPPEVTRRFAVGVVPHYGVPDYIAHNPHCILDFAAGSVVAIESDGTPRLAHEGTFQGTCEGGAISKTFEAVVVRGVQVMRTSGKGGLRDFELDVQHPEWTMGLKAYPLDANGQGLDPGRFSSQMRGYARWHLGQGCDRVVTFTPDAGQAEDAAIDRPRDWVELSPVGVGTCRIDVDYFDARTHVTVMVR
ncbi:hypothetical protein [Nannocystis radixulma]|uniref:Uncharacterized protein n=1 Tax=Nannocystis radixulma TaxID=2995305 RepID=A0ABT5B2W8_9BACT|nr:hypothetical protein [Nannocystis radixulma]MDC0667778.1 hypothetical protein [Nannocystis radixulma]